MKIYAYMDKIDRNKESTLSLTFFVNIFFENIRAKNTARKSIRGFTLIEMMVAVSIFSIVMLVAIGSLVTVIDANRKAQSLQSVINNISFAIESMSRTARVGSSYYCFQGNSNPAPVDSNGIEKPLDCVNGGTLIAFEAHDGNPNERDDQVVYRLNGTSIERSLDGGSTFVSLTSSRVRIDHLKFYVIGSDPNDSLQSRILVTISGTAGVSVRSETKFNLQTTITQRVPDIP